MAFPTALLYLSNSKYIVFKNFLKKWKSHILFQIHFSINSTSKLYIYLHVCVLCTTANLIPFSVNCQYSAFFWLFDLCFFCLIMIKQIKKCVNALLSLWCRVQSGSFCFNTLEKHDHKINLKSIVSYKIYKQKIHKINYNIHIFRLFNQRSL